MRRFPWVTWAIAGLFIFLLFFGLSYIAGILMYPATFDLYQAGYAASIMTSLIYWYMANHKPRIGGTLRIDTTRDHKDIWRFEVDDFEKFDNDECVIIEIKRRHVPDTSDDYIQKVESVGREKE